MGSTAFERKDVGHWNLKKLVGMSRSSFFLVSTVLFCCCHQTRMFNLSEIKHNSSTISKKKSHFLLGKNPTTRKQWVFNGLLLLLSSCKKFTKIVTQTTLEPGWWEGLVFTWFSQLSMNQNGGFLWFHPKWVHFPAFFEGFHRVLKWVENSSPGLGQGLDSAGL